MATGPEEPRGRPTPHPLFGKGTLVALFAWGLLVLAFSATYFYNRVGGSTLIAISMHGLHNDSVFLQGRINAEGLGPYVISELTLLAPILTTVCTVVFVSGRSVGLVEKAG